MGATSDGAALRRSDDPGTVTTNRLLSERAATRLGFDRLSRALGRPDWAPYLLLGVVYFVDVPVLSTVRFLQTGYHPYVANPASVFVVLLAVFAIWGSRRLRDRYDAAVEALTDEEGEPIADDSIEAARPRPSAIGRAILRFGTAGRTADDRERLETLAAPRLKYLAILGAWALYAAWILLNPTIQRLIVEAEGPLIGGVKFGLFVPFVYLPLGAEFFVTYLGIIVLLPLEISELGVIDFQDPHGFGGLRPVGDLIRSASTYYLLGFGGYVAGIGLGRLLARAGFAPPMGAVTTAFIGGGITVGVALFAYPIVVVHGHMKGAKHDKIDALASEVRRCGPPEDSNMFPETAVPDSVEEGNSYVHLYIKMRRVENMREFPVDVPHLQEFVLAALVPFVAHVTVTSLASGGGGH